MGMADGIERTTVRAELDEWVDGLETLLDAHGTPVDGEMPPARVWAAIERRIASMPQDPRPVADYRSSHAAGRPSPGA